MTKKILLGLSTLLFLTHCNSQKTNQKQLTRCDDFNIIINSPDTLAKDQDLFASIHIDNPKYKLIRASYGCNVTDTSTVDTLTTGYSYGRIYGCNQTLLLEHDSVKIGLHVGQETGKFNFEEVTLIAKGVDNKYYYQKCTFDYCVK